VSGDDDVVERGSLTVTTDGDPTTGRRRPVDERRRYPHAVMEGGVMAVISPSTTRTGPSNAILSGARTTSLVVVGLWAATWAVETGFAAWVRHAAKTPPPQ
jgi:hypothetical protein